MSLTKEALLDFFLTMSSSFSGVQDVQRSHLGDPEAINNIPDITILSEV